MATTNGARVKENVQDERLRRRKAARVEQFRQRANYERTITEFQPDAVEIEHRRVPGGARWTLYTVMALITATVLWACWAQVDEIVVGQGKLITTENAVVVQSFSTAPIRSLNVQFGDRVTAGQIVATLDPTFSDADLIQLESRRNATEATIRRLRAELDGIEFVIDGHESDRDWITQLVLFRERKLAFEAEMERADADLDKFKVQKQNTDGDIEFNQRQLKIYREVQQKMASLETRKSATSMEVLSAQLRTMESERTLKTANNTIRELTADIDAREKQRNSFIAGQRSEIADELLKASQELSAVEQEINKANRMGELMELRVPTDSGHSEFVVFEVADRSVGSILKEGEPLFKLIPIDVPLEAEVEISGRDVAKLRVLKALPESGDLPNGSKVTLKLSAFDYQDHGTLNGYVRTVSEGVFEKPAGASGATPAATFKARIKLIEPTKLKNVPPDFRLMPGMAATAEIKVGKRRVIQYFLYPILRYLDEGFREP